MSNPAANPSPTPRPSDSDAPASSLNFHSENIGNWTSKQENPFAAQNREAQARQAKRTATLKKAKPYLIAVGAVAAAALVAWVVILIIGNITKPADTDPPVEIAGNSLDDISEYRSLLQSLFDENGGVAVPAFIDLDPAAQQVDIDNEAALAIVKQTVENSINSANGQLYANAITLAHLLFLQDNGLYAEALEEAQTIDPESLTPEQKITYLGVLYYSNYCQGNYDEANEYFIERYNLSYELYGTDEGDGGDRTAEDDVNGLINDDNINQ